MTNFVLFGYVVTVAEQIHTRPQGKAPIGTPIRPVKVTKGPPRTIREGPVLRGKSPAHPPNTSAPV